MISGIMLLGGATLAAAAIILSLAAIATANGHAPQVEPAEPGQSDLPSADGEPQEPQPIEEQTTYELRLPLFVGSGSPAEIAAAVRAQYPHPPIIHRVTE